LGKPLIHPNWAHPPEGIADGFSPEMTAKDEASLRDAAPLIPPDTPIAITYLPGEEVAARVAATVAVRELRFEPRPHFSARRITSEDDFETYLRTVVGQAGVRRCFIVAGDPPEPQGRCFDTTALLQTGAFERSGLKAIGIGDEHGRVRLHFYPFGGMVISGVAAKLGARIDALVYIDAFLPGQNQSLWDITGEFEHKHYIDTQMHAPGLVAPIMGELSERIGLHPLLTLLEAVHYTGAEAKIAHRIYIFANNWQPTPFVRFRNQVVGEGHWELHELRSGHDVMSDQPDQLLKIVLDCA
jgi:hypothetical protein